MCLRHEGIGLLFGFETHSGLGALGGLEAALDPAWQIVPLIKVGSDLTREAATLFRTLTHLVTGGRCVEVPVPNNRVTLRYQSAERRCERMSGGVPGWTWSELGPMVRDLDVLYLNFISGFELELGTVQALRQAYPGPIYADLHSLLDLDSGCERQQCVVVTSSRRQFAHDRRLEVVRDHHRDELNVGRVVRDRRR